MSGEKEIRTKIGSISNTQKITKAMEMVAASKMRRAQQRMAASRPYAEKIREVIGHAANAHIEYKHPYLIARENVRNVGFIVISTDRGLCGGLNVNLLKTGMHAIQEWSNKNVDIKISAIGSKAATFYKRFGGLISEASHLGDAPELNDIIGAIQVMLTAYDEGEIDRLFLVENEFVNTMTQKPKVSQLLPVVASDSEEVATGYWDYLYEPEAVVVLDTMLKRYVESQVYQAVIENIACEMAARMVAMKSASENAGDIINDLQLIYNKARQAAITQEISEIVSGAAAV